MKKRENKEYKVAEFLAGEKKSCLATNILSIFCQNIFFLNKLRKGINKIKKFLN